ncbi:MAG: glycosyltransferase family 4 protein [Bacteroidales bacterium]|nr:glycosyltransferase family 4 protein [Bacteroidales bacterium]
MNIAVNTRFLIPGKLDGIGWFTFEVVRRLTRDHPEHTFRFFFDRQYAPEFIFSENVQPVILRPPARHPVLWHIWFQHNLARYLKKHPSDLFFSPDGFIPLKTDIPAIPVIHDLNFMHYPEELPKSVSRYYHRFFPEFAERAAHIITVSEFSKKDITRQFGIAPEKISVAWNGIHKIFKPLSEETRQETRAQISGGDPYFVHIGSLLPRKNIPRLLQAFDLFRASSSGTYKIVIAGRPMFGTNEIKKTLQNMKYAKDVILTGNLSREKSYKILGSAEALIFASYFEGFGIPLAEAMACHVPVIAADATAIPEVCGDAALYVDPFSKESINQAMLRITKDPFLRKQLVEKGVQRATFFNWDHTAAKVWAVIEQTLQK